jgi:hypothetical protein
MKIFDLTPGSIITRTEPMCYFSQVTGGSHTDDRYIGEKITFHGIANGMIYGTLPNKELEKGDMKLMAVPVHQWEEGWEYYIDPMTMIIKSEETIQNSLQNRLFEALENQDYREAARLRDELAAKPNNEQKMIG